MTPINPPSLPLGLTQSNLTVQKERTYHTLVLVLSILFWLAITVSIIGIFYAAFIGFFLWLGNGLLVAYLRSESIRVDKRQLPELHQTFREVCQQLGVRQEWRLVKGCYRQFLTPRSGYTHFVAGAGE